MVALRERKIKMEARKAAIEEFSAVRAFYHKMTDWLDTVPYGLGWRKDIYPSPEELTSALEKGELWVWEDSEGYAAAMILNSGSQEEYAKVKWELDATPDEVLVIHALGVMPKYHGTGLSHELVKFAIRTAKEQGKKGMRLDVLAGNLPAERLYPKFNFKLIETIEMFYEDTGLAMYKLYELAF